MPDEPAAETTSILVVDDEAALRNALAQFLRKEGYEVDTAADGAGALERVRQGGVHLMLLDVRMPGMSGIDVVPEALDIDPDLGIVMLSGVTDATSAAICMQRGAYDYLTKPIELTDLRAALERAVRKRHTILQSHNISKWLKEEVERRTHELAEQKRRLEQVSIATLEALVNALEAKSEWLSGHSARVAAYSASLASELELSDDDVDAVRMAGRLHDLGKIGIREAVLDKRGPLTPEEYEHVKQHVVIGSQILSPLGHLGHLVTMVRHHHEHWDGSGYPDGLKGEEIPLGARIICAVEIYDALTTLRPYQEKLTPEKAAERMRMLSGTLIDPTVMEAFAATIARRQTLVFIAEEEGGVAH